MMKAIVTVKFDMQPDRDKEGRIHKVSGVCPLSLELHKSIYCNDVYGKHHSYIEEGKDIKEIKQKAEEMFGHVTRIEVISDE